MKEDLKGRKEDSEGRLEVNLGDVLCLLDVIACTNGSVCQSVTHSVTLFEFVS